MKKFITIGLLSGDPTNWKLKLRLSILLLLVSLLNIEASTYSQNTKISLDMESVSVESVLKMIESQSEFKFFCNVNVVDIDRIVTVKADKQRIFKILNQLFDESNTIYNVVDRQIILTADPNKNKEEISVVPIKTIPEQQEIEISGTIRDTDGIELPGVNIILKGTSKGVVSDFDGNYSISVPDETAIIVVSYIGMATQEIVVGSQTTIDFVLIYSALSMDEVIITGYTSQVKGEVTGAVSTVDDTFISNKAFVDPSEALRGSSGVTVLESSTPGGTASISIRGISTINNNDPLWIVDGVFGGTVTPDNIETISILKDAATQAIYGARAANGVIIVTTKGGRKNQKAKFTFNARSGITQNSNKYNLLNTQEYGELLWLEAANSGITNFSHPQYGSGSVPVIPDYINPTAGSEGDPGVNPDLYDNQLPYQDGDDTYLITRANKTGTDWLKEAEQNARYREYTMDISGGSEATAYAFQLGYLEEEGIMKHTGYERFNLRSNVSSKLADWLEIGERIGVIVNNYQGLQDDNGESSPISMTYRMQPIVPVYDIMDTYAGTRASATGNGKNPLFQLDSNKDDFLKSTDITGNIYLKLTPGKGFTFKTLFGVNHIIGHSKDYNFVEVAHSEREEYDGLSEMSTFSTQWNWSNTLEYKNTFADVHDLTVLIGAESVENNSNFIQASRELFFVRDVDFMQISSGLAGIQNSGSESSWSLFSLFGRLNYNYDNKYLFEAVVRRDGSSRFSEDNRYGTFPAFSAGWRISNENFMESSKNWLEQLKIRGSWGQVGNDRIGNYNSNTIYDVNFSRSVYDLNGLNNTIGVTGFARTQFGSDDVKWETTTSSNFGIDATIFRNVSFSFDLWQRTTSDMLFPQQLPQVYGEGDFTSVNVGEMKNKGFDFQLGYANTAANGEFKYNFNVIISHYKNEVVSLSSNVNEFLEGDSYRGNVYTRAETGRSFPEFYGYVVEGIFQTPAEVAAHEPAFGDYNEVGRYKFKNVDGNDVINAGDRTYIGSPHPDFTTGLDFTLSYKGFRLSSFLYASVGNEMVNSVRTWTDFRTFEGNRSHDRLYNSWGSPYLDNNANAKLPKAEVSSGISQQPSTVFVEDASYWRMQNIMLNYDLTKFLPGKSSLQVYLQMTNVFTLTNYSGLDPNLNSGGINMGVDRGAWPTPKRFLVGLTYGL